MSSLSTQPSEVPAKTTSKQRGFFQRLFGQRELGIFLVVLFLGILLTFTSPTLPDRRKYQDPDRGLIL